MERDVGWIGVGAGREMGGPALTGFSRDALPADGDSDPSPYLIDCFIWDSSILSKDIEIPESVDAGFVAFGGV